MSRGVLPTEAFTLANVPGPEAERREVIRFATSLNGTEAVGREDVRAAASAWTADGPEALDLHGLRVALFARQRAHYASGGGWPDGDPILDEMREIVAEIRRRVEAQAPGVAVWRGDLTTLAIDAVVNAANASLLGGGGVDGAIHCAAGVELRRACEQFPRVGGVRCPVGEARITPGFALPAQHVIHTVGPRWRGGEEGEADLLASAYRSSLALAAEHGAASVAFPAISTGVYGYPASEAAAVAVRTVAGWLAVHGTPSRVLLVAFDAEAERTLHTALDAHDARP